MKLGSLFTGSGMLDVAVERVFGAQTVFHCEVDPAASFVLSQRFPGVLNLGDITKVDWEEVGMGEFCPDILCGGFPCQDVSAAGRKAGLGEGTRSGLWSYFRDAIEVLRPPVVVIENVRGLLSAKAVAGSDVDEGESRPVLRAMGAVLGNLSDLGYDAVWSTVPASAVGAPHKRERVFIVAYSAGAGPQGVESESGWWDGFAVGGFESVSLLPTPVVSDARSSGRHSTSTGVMNPGTSLTDALRSLPLLPTPGAADGSGGHINRSGARKGELLLGGIARAYETGELLPTPAAKISGPDYARMRRPESGGHDLVTAIAYHKLESSRWGKYEAAVLRWEELTRPVPAPTEPNAKGNPRIAPAFPEWMMGWPEGWVTDFIGQGIVRNDALRLIGNGVVPQQAFAALSAMIGA